MAKNMTFSELESLVHRLPDAYGKPPRGRETENPTNTWRLFELNRLRQNEFQEELQEVEAVPDMTALSESDSAENVFGTATPDLDGDGDVTTDDLELLNKYLAGVVELSEEQLALADINGDGTADLTDATLLAKFLRGLPTYELQQTADLYGVTAGDRSCASLRLLIGLHMGNTLYGCTCDGVLKTLSAAFSFAAGKEIGANYFAVKENYQFASGGASGTYGSAIPDIDEDGVVTSVIDRFLISWYAGGILDKSQEYYDNVEAYVNEHCGGDAQKALKSAVDFLDYAAAVKKKPDAALYQDFLDNVGETAFYTTIQCDSGVAAYLEKIELEQEEFQQELEQILAVGTRIGALEFVEGLANTADESADE